MKAEKEFNMLIKELKRVKHRLNSFQGLQISNALELYGQLLEMAAEVKPFTIEAQLVERDEFIKHLEHASRVVQTWPAWQQEILGGEAAE